MRPVSMTTAQVSSERWEVVSVNFLLLFYCLSLSLSLSLPLSGLCETAAVCDSFTRGWRFPQFASNSRKQCSKATRLCLTASLWPVSHQKMLGGGGCVSGRVSVNVKWMRVSRGKTLIYARPWTSTCDVGVLLKAGPSVTLSADIWHGFVFAQSQ